MVRTKSILFVIFAGWSLYTNAQIITTVTGNGTLGDSGDGNSAAEATISEPFACAFDSRGNFYFTEVGSEKVRKISTLGIINTIAGGGSTLGDGGPATAAQFSDPSGIAIDDSDNIYIMDNWGYRLRKIDANTGIITTIAGNGTSGYAGDNEPATASIIEANNVCVDGLGNIYISDVGNNRIRKIDTSGIIRTVAGNGVNGYSGDDSMATSAKIALGIGICTDNNDNLYFSQGNNIRKINTAGIVTTIAGNGSSAGGDGGPASAAGIAAYELQCDKQGNLYVTGYIQNVVRKIDNAGVIHTVAGNGIAAYSGDGGQVTSAELHTPIGIALDSCGNLFIADRDDNHIRKVAFNPACWPQSTRELHTSTMNVYPNPTYDELNIDDVQSATAYSLLSITGAVRQRGELQRGSNTIPMQSLAAGMYLLELMNSENEKTVMKIVKE